MMGVEECSRAVENLWKTESDPVENLWKINLPPDPPPGSLGGLDYDDYERYYLSTKQG